MMKKLGSSIPRIMHCLGLLVALSLLYGCGAAGGRGSSSSLPSQPSQSLSVTVAPLAVEIRAGTVEQFSATVLGSLSAPVPDGVVLRSTRASRFGPAGTRSDPIHLGAANKRIIWSINGTQGGNAAVGTISATGLYHSPSILPSPNMIYVTAASMADSSVSQTALVTLYNPIPTITSVTPNKVWVGPFTVTVTGQNFVQGAQVLFAGTSLPTTFKSSTQLVATGAATQPGIAQVRISNPQPGSTSSTGVLTVQVMAQQLVTAPPTAPQTSWDPTILGVSWASAFAPIASNQIDVTKDPRLRVKATGDGVTDDTPAIRAAIQLASSSGGGLVYFPAGDYKIVTPSNSARGNPLVVPSRIILRGAGPTMSRLFVNDSYAASETDGIWTWGGISFQGSSQSGMTDLGVYAVNSSTSPCALLWNRGSNKVGELFFNNLDIHLGNSRNFWFEAVDNLLIQSSRFDSSSLNYGPAYVVGNSHVSFLGNTITYHFGRVQMQHNVGLLVQHNILVRDAGSKDQEEGTAIESGGIEISFGHAVQILDNTIQTKNAPSREAGDGEAIMSQQSTVQDVLDAGSVTAVSSTTLTDTNALWGPVTQSRLTRFPEVVAILTGSATGEWRTIKALNSKVKTLTLDQPWNPVPEVGSLYSVFAWTLMDANIQGNKLIDNPSGIALWDGCYNCNVQNNTLINSRGIILRTVDKLLNASTYPEGRRVHHVAINNKISNNIVSNTSGLRPAYIVLDTEAFDASSYRGMGMINIELSGNMIEPYSASPHQTYSPTQGEIAQEGFFPCFLFGPALAKDPVNTVFQAVHFWNNSQSVPVTYRSTFSPFTTHACVIASAPSTANTP
jgi:parallel beta-helix repeat protein